MYADNTDSIDEILTIKIPHQVSVGMECCTTFQQFIISVLKFYISVARSQLDVANLLHGDSIRYEKQNKSLQSMGCLHKVVLIT